jgi:hypothetical protein
MFKSRNFQINSIGLIVSCLVGAVFLFSETVSANSLYFSEQEIADIFGNADDNDSVIFTPEGTYLHGKAVTYDSNDPEGEKRYDDSETDASAITIKVLKEKYRTTPKDLLHLEAEQFNRETPPTVERSLPGGSYELSGSFSGSFWRFANVLYKPAPNTGGPYLKWSVYIDSAYIGDSGQAWNTYYGSPSGTALYPTDFGRYLTGAGNLTTYYTKNPIHGAHYFVENR